MKRRKLIRVITPQFVLIVLLALIATIWFASSTFKKFYYRELENTLEIRAHLLLEQFASIEKEDAQDFCRRMGAKTHARITLIERDGLVIGDSDKDANTMDNHATRPEIANAFRTGRGVATRYSHTVKKDMMYVAIYDSEVSPNLVMRVSLSVNAIDDVLANYSWRMILGGVVVAFVIIVGSYLVFQRITDALNQIKEASEKFANGELNHAMPSSQVEEVALLAEAMNQMAEQVEERFRVSQEQQNEMKAVLGSMTEGLIAIDEETRVLDMNRAAKRLWDLENLDDVKGKHLSQLVASSELMHFAENTLKSNGPLKSEVVMEGGERVYQFHGSNLETIDGSPLGALLVFFDVSRLKRLENMRKDFVANVSHELKTPITSIKGFSETLLDGAYEDSENLLKFLKIIFKQADRLEAIVEDLLTLSRLDQEEASQVLSVMNMNVVSLLESVKYSCEPQAQEKKVNVDIIDNSEGVQCSVDPRLLEQAVTNLVTNAIKYSPESTQVNISVDVVGDDCVIKVADSGMGIAKEHLPRIFERFYRVDKGRSRLQGGTGLGLSIVKNIIQMHGGQVEVESYLGQGSVFTIILPVVTTGDEL